MAKRSKEYWCGHSMKNQANGTRCSSSCMAAQSPTFRTAGFLTTAIQARSPPQKATPSFTRIIEAARDAASRSPKITRPTTAAKNLTTCWTEWTTWSSQASSTDPKSESRVVRTAALLPPGARRSTANISRRQSCLSASVIRFRNQARPTSPTRCFTSMLENGSGTTGNSSSNAARSTTSSKLARPF